MLLAATVLKSLLTYISVALLSAVKFFWALISALILDFNFAELMIFGAGGAIVGCWVFAYFGTEISKWIRKRFPRRKPMSFKRRRRIVKLWKAYGLLGVAVLVPVISTMIGVGIAVSFQEKPRRIMVYMSISVIVYTILVAVFRDAVLQMFG
ncbi:MAG: hypothetical protein AAF206_24635 [Bacteroidota bacterium]